MPKNRVQSESDVMPARVSHSCFAVPL